MEIILHLHKWILKIDSETTISKIISEVNNKEDTSQSSNSDDSNEISIEITLKIKEQKLRQNKKDKKNNAQKEAFGRTMACHFERKREKANQVKQLASLKEAKWLDLL